MCLLFETIKVVEGILQNISYHEERVNRSIEELFGEKNKWSIAEMVHIPDDIENGIYKCKFIYAKNVKKIEFVPYKKKTINSLKLVNNNDIKYNYKYFDRSCFEKILNNCDADDILIVQDGKITDTSFANIIFFDGKKWYTSSKPLLTGTKRAKLLAEKIIIEKDIYVEDIASFVGAKLINAMLDIDDSAIIHINNIRYFF